MLVVELYTFQRRFLWIIIMILKTTPRMLKEKYIMIIKIIKTSKKARKKIVKSFKKKRKIMTKKKSLMKKKGRILARKKANLIKKAEKIV